MLERSGRLSPRNSTAGEVLERVFCFLLGEVPSGALAVARPRWGAFSSSGLARPFTVPASQEEGGFTAWAPFVPAHCAETSPSS